jgi:hypothetical protein
LKSFLSLGLGSFLSPPRGEPVGRQNEVNWGLFDSIAGWDDVVEIECQTPVDEKVDNQPSVAVSQ